MNIHQLLFDNIQKHVALNPAEQAFLFSYFQFKAITKKEHLLQQEHPCNHIYFVNAGLLRAYHLNESGKESTIMFAVKDWWITDMPCFIKQQAAKVSIVALSNCELLQLSKSDMELLLERLPKLERYFRILFQNAYIREQLRVLDNLSLPAEVRYDRFVQKYPQIVPLVTQKQIASYLGVTPEFLSSVRGKGHRK